MLEVPSAVACRPVGAAGIAAGVVASTVVLAAEVRPELPTADTA